MSAEHDSNLEYKAKYTLSHTDGGYQMRFFCAACDYHYSTGWISAHSEALARLLAEREARRYFNGCHNCGKWVCDAHYNADKMRCLECAPLMSNKR